MNISFSNFFFLLPLLTSFSVVGTTKFLIFDLAVALDSAMYNWPSENTVSSKYTLTLGRVCPCALLIVIAKLSRMRNCFLLNWKENMSSSDEPKGMRGKKKTRFPAFVSQHNFYVYCILLEPYMIVLYHYKVRFVSFF